ncbi:MAG: 3-phosphoshikimate 1-carboxyvinyltransferase [Prevotellaceae bacterium]|nr:3-phosphoshikimate 1-carboxyvinyltransferase [Candidatus Faecinaster equi]
MIQIGLPLSKSIINRLLVIRKVRGLKEELCIDTDDMCDDVKVMTDALKITEGVVNIGAAGTAMRFLTAYYAATEGSNVLLTGSERMKERPIGTLVDALKQLGADIEYTLKEGFPPLKIKGKKLKGGSLAIDGNISSQFISALLMVEPLMKEKLNLEINGDLVSAPYVEMTKKMMALPCMEIKQEKDWTAASYWFEAVALTKNELLLNGVDINSIQGDSRWTLEFFKQLGVEAKKEENGLLLSYNQPKSNQNALDWNFRDCPDLVPTMVVTCCMMEKTFCFTGLSTLRIKETDRIKALRKELLKIGYVLKEEGDDVLRWDGKKINAVERIEIDTYNDHRMAMAFGIATLVNTNILIKNIKVVNKSYNNFWKEWGKVKSAIRQESCKNEGMDDVCGVSCFCDEKALQTKLSEEIIYFDDEELDEYRGIDANEYTEDQIDAFYEVLTTMRKEEVNEWLHSLELRGIELPQQLKETAIMIMSD